VTSGGTTTPDTRSVRTMVGGLARRALPAIEREELEPLARLGGLFFLVILAFTLARVARDGFFLSRVPVHYLPYVSLALAAATAVFALVLEWLSRGLSSSRTLALLALFTGLSLVSFGDWLGEGGSAAPVVFYVWVGVYGPLLVSEFWSTANEELDARQARRLFSVIGALGVLGGLSAGALASGASGMTPAAALGWAAVAQVGVAALSWRRKPAGPRRSSREGEEPLGVSMRRPYVRGLAALFLVGGVTSGVLDYEWKLALQELSADPRRLTRLLGAFYGGQNLLALVSQIGLSTWVLSRFGVRGASMAVPAGILAGSAATALAPILPWVLAVRLYDAGLRNSFARTAWELLLFPLAPGTRRATKRILDGVVNRGAEAVAGLAVLLLMYLWRAAVFDLALLTALLAAAWVALELRVGRAYGRELALSLEQMLSAGASQSVSPEEAGAVGELVRLLDSPAERDVLYAIDRLQAVDVHVLADRADRLSQHPSATVRERVAALRVLWTGAPSRPPTGTGAALRPPAAESAAEGGSALEALAARVGDTDPEVRRGAFRSLGLLGARESIPFLLESLARPPDRAFAREALCLYGRRVVGTLGDHLVDATTALRIRREIPRVLSLLPSQDALHALLRGAGTEGDAVLLQRTLWAMTRIRKERADVVLAAPIVDGHVRGELEVSHRLGRWRRVASASGDADGTALLVRALDERKSQSRQRLFRRLALVYSPREMLRASRALASPEPRVRAQGMEYLDAVLSPEHKALVIPALERRALEAGADPFPTEAATGALGALLVELLAGDDAWLQTCALFAAGSLALAQLSPVVERAEDAPDEIVRETARWASRKLANVPEEDMKIEPTLTTAQRSLFLLSEVETFKPLSGEEVAGIAARMTELRFPAGETVYEGEDTERRMYIILEGAIEQVRDGIVVRRARRGMMFGFFALLGVDYTETVRTLESTHVLSLRQEDFMDAVSDSPSFSFGVIRGLSRSILALLKRIEDLERRVS
jgi:Cyclic nucleotide-binding domain/HEAT repeats